MDVLIIIPPVGFVDDEVTVSMGIFSESNVGYEIATTERGYCKGMSGMIIQPDKRVDEVAPTHYHAVLVIGGEGSRDLWNNDAVLTVVKDAYAHGGIIAGINYGVGVLAHAGILEDKKATISPSPDALETLSSFGALYVKKPVVVDDNVVTAEGAYATLDFMIDLLDIMGVEWYTI